MNPALGARLEAACAAADLTAAVARDPVRFPRRYSDVPDVEIAGVYAALLAFGRVELFGAVLERLFALMDDAGGPHRWVLDFDARSAARLAPIQYRWFRAEDFVRLTETLQACYRLHPRLEHLFVGPALQPALAGAVRTLRGLVPGTPSRAFATWLPDPEEGSACKRWLMFLRWMVRRDGVDLGVWTRLAPRDLVIPLDTHVMRISGFLGLTRRTTANWRTAEEVTAALRVYDPEDPVRFDFALAHLGISGACRGHRDPTVCPRCPLDPLCLAPGAPAPAISRARPPAAANTTTTRRRTPRA